MIVYNDSREDTFSLFSNIFICNFQSLNNGSKNCAISIVHSLDKELNHQSWFSKKPELNKEVKKEKTSKNFLKPKKKPVKESEQENITSEKKIETKEK